MSEKKENFFVNNKEILIQCMVAAVSPLIICVIYCAVRGYSFFDLYLPNSYNNDVLFYYKQVEGIIFYGHPQGYFGFNESHAVYGGFAAWNPILFIPWIVYCKIFGCNYMSLIISNILYFSVAMVAFVLLTKMDWRGIIAGFLMFALYPGFSIHLMNGLAETNVAATMIIFFGLSIHISKNGYRKSDIIGMFFIGALLTLCRPFMILLLIIPCYHFIKKRGKIGILFSALIVAFSVTGYFIYSHYFSSPYLESLFNADLIKLLISGRFVEFYWKLVPLVKQFFQYNIGAFDYGLTAGTQYVISEFAVLAIIIVTLIRKKTEYLITYIGFACTVIGLTAANILLLNKIREGGRHLWAFSIIGILLCVLIEKREKYVINGILIIFLIIFIARGAIIPTDYDIPTPNNDLQATIDELKIVFEEKGVCITEGSPWDNTVIWASKEYKQLYSLPAGMGISYCYDNYALENMESLNSKYIAVDINGLVEEACWNLGYEQVVRTDTFAIFRRY